MRLPAPQGYEPTSMRAIRARYNPYVQARARVDQQRRLGHSVDKVGRAAAWGRGGCAGLGALLARTLATLHLPPGGSSA